MNQVAVTELPEDVDTAIHGGAVSRRGDETSLAGVTGTSVLISAGLCKSRDQLIYNQGPGVRIGVRSRDRDSDAQTVRLCSFIVELPGTHCTQPICAGRNSRTTAQAGAGAAARPWGMTSSGGNRSFTTTSSAGPPARRAHALLL